MKKILYFTNPETCAPCRTLGPIMDDLSIELHIEKINTGNEAELTVQYGVRAIPTAILVVDGVEKKRFQGVKSPEFIRDFYNN
jgi:thioredoxin 1